MTNSRYSQMRRALYEIATTASDPAVRTRAAAALPPLIFRQTARFCAVCDAQTKGTRKYCSSVCAASVRPELAQYAKARMEIVSRRLDGETAVSIAKSLGVTPSSVHSRFKRQVREIWSSAGRGDKIAMGVKRKLEDAGFDGTGSIRRHPDPALSDERPDTERENEIFERRLSGIPAKEIATQHGVSVAFVNAIVRLYLQHMRGAARRGNATAQRDMERCRALNLIR